MRARAAELGFQSPRDRGFLHRSPSLTALQVPDGVEPESLRARVREAGIQIAGGLGAYKPTCIRIGHMGDIRMEDVERTMDALGRPA